LPRERFGSSYSNLTQVVALDNTMIPGKFGMFLVYIGFFLKKSFR
jgi:hypothetical protein